MKSWQLSKDTGTKGDPGMRRNGAAFPARGICMLNILEAGMSLGITWRSQ